uniref:Cyclin-dependent kinases regulatory subunit n=1 Tax=Parascaris equorum TaxID=6256 RepID=A0A914S174_PAREQ
MTEPEWRSLGVQQSPGWVHYMIHEPERHVSIFFFLFLWCDLCHEASL